MTPDTNKERAGRFTKKPVTIDAWLIDPANKPHPSWVHNAFAGSDIDWCPAGKGLYINTLEGHMLGGHGDYLIRGVQSELYACKAHIFAATYEPEARASLAAKAPAAPTGWYALAADGMATLCVDRDDAEKTAADNEKKRPNCGPYRAVQLYTAPPAPTEQWVSVAERLPEWVHRDDTPCHINGKEVPPTLTSKTVLVALDGGGVRTDKLTTIEGKSDGWWHTYGERVVAWQDTPAPPQGAAKGDGNG